VSLAARRFPMNHGSNPAHRGHLPLQHRRGRTVDKPKFSST
jgi:hypothetical protein